VGLLLVESLTASIPVRKRKLRPGTESRNLRHSGMESVRVQGQNLLVTVWRHSCCRRAALVLSCLVILSSSQLRF
jgi:hypothetical protein